MEPCVAALEDSYGRGWPGRWLRPVLGPMGAVEADRLSQSLAQIDVRAPLQHPANLAIIDVNRADIDRLALGGKRHQAVRAGPGHFDQHFGELPQADRLDRAHIEDLAISSIVGAR